MPLRDVKDLGMKGLSAHTWVALAENVGVGVRGGSEGTVNVCACCSPSSSCCLAYASPYAMQTALSFSIECRCSNSDFGLA